MPGRELTGEMSAGFAAAEGMGTGMVLAHSLPPSPISLRVSLASPAPPPEAQLEGHVHPTAQAGTEIPRCFYGVLLLHWSLH